MMHTVVAVVMVLAWVGAPILYAVLGSRHTHSFPWED